MAEGGKGLILLTGGGTAGHVTPNLALAPRLRTLGFDVAYVGSREGMERGLAEAAGLPYHGVASGKLRRYLDARNFTDPLRVLAGLGQAWGLLGRLRPKAVFSKGGFVTVPVVVAARLRGVPAILHESDLTPGLANRLAIPCARKVCVSFRETLARLPAGKGVWTGAPVRPELLAGDREAGRRFLGLDAAKPVLLAMGGSLGSKVLNRNLRACLETLARRFYVVHLCGKGGLDAAAPEHLGYRQYEFLGRELPDVLAAADLALSRAGSNSLFELLALAKPHLLVPLSRAASRGDQIENAKVFAAAGYSRVLPEEELSPERLERELAALWDGRDGYRGAMAAAGFRNGLDGIVAEITALAGG